MLYTIDIWCTPPHGAETGPSAVGSAAAVRQLAKVQRAGTMAITGGLRTSPRDALDACACTIPAKQLAEKWCHSVAVRLSTLPPARPLYKMVKVKRQPVYQKAQGPATQPHADLQAQTGRNSKNSYGGA